MTNIPTDPPPSVQELCISACQAAITAGQPAPAAAPRGSREGSQGAAAAAAAVVSAASTGRLAAVARQLHDGVLTADCDVRAVRAVLSCLEFMRQTHRAALYTGDSGGHCIAWCR